MFGVRTKSAIYEARIEDLKLEHRRTVDALAEQIEYLRMQLGRPSAAAPLNPTNQPETMVSVNPWMNENEEEVRAMFQTGQIDKEQLEKALAEIGAMNQEIEFDS